MFDGYKVSIVADMWCVLSQSCWLHSFMSFIHIYVKTEPFSVRLISFLFHAAPQIGEDAESIASIRSRMLYNPDVFCLFPPPSPMTI